MATLQSSRSQCCCCAIGVFAALFGMIMLSAGICIVLNVNYMEVDTSGLPSDLHNEQGKKVVGIILICVAIGALGLSGTVSIIYFVFCNRKPRTTLNPSSQEGGTSNGNGTHANSHNARHGSHHGQQRASIDGTRIGYENQQSHSTSKQRRQSPSVTPPRGATGPRKKSHKTKIRHIRNQRRHTALPPHIEEPETAKSQVDLSQHQSHSSDTKRTPEVETTALNFATTKFENTPAIVIDDLSRKEMTSDISLTQSTNLNLTNSSMNLSDTFNAGESLNMTEESTLYDDEETGETTPIHYHNMHSDLQITSEMSTEGKIDRTGQPHFTTSSDINDHTSSTRNAHPVSSSPESMTPPTVVVAAELGEQSSIESNSYILKVQPQNDVNSSKSQSVSAEHSKGDKGEWDNEPIPDLPLSSRYHEKYSSPNENDSSSFNSAFSNDGGDPNDEDMKKVHDKMRELL